MYKYKIEYEYSVSGETRIDTLHIETADLGYIVNALFKKLKADSVKITMEKNIRNNIEKGE